MTVILLLQIDDELNPEVQAMYDKATQHKESEAFVYFWGIQAALDEDPQVVVQQVFDSIKYAEKKYFNNITMAASFDFMDYPKNKKISFPHDARPVSQLKKQDPLDLEF